MIPVASQPKLPQLFRVSMVLRVLLLLAGCFCLGACNEVLEDRAERASERADRKMGEGDFRGAILLYEKALDGSEKTAEIHYKLGMAYENNLNDPLGATHHFRRYLSLAPKGPHAKDINSILKQDELKLASAFSAGGLMSQKEGAVLKNANLELQKANAGLTQKLNEQARLMTAQGLQLRQLRGKSGEPPPVQEQKPIPPGARTYVVGPGDTLASISRKFYKGSARWKDIQDANFNMLEGTAKLKPGMTLIIP